MSFIVFLIAAYGLHYLVYTIIHMRRYNKFSKLVEEDQDRALKYFEDHKEMGCFSYDRNQLRGLLGGRQWPVGHSCMGDEWFAFTSDHNSEDWYIKDFIKKFGK